MTQHRTHWLTWVFAALVLIPTILGFANKFLDLVLVVQGDEEGAFAITPIVNYLFATAGFMCLLVWTAMQGAFENLDAPSRTMFENELRLDGSMPAVTDSGIPTTPSPGFALTTEHVP